MREHPKLEKIMSGASYAPFLAPQTQPTEDIVRQDDKIIFLYYLLWKGRE
jgi:hypothetical protein